MYDHSGPTEMGYISYQDQKTRTQRVGHCRLIPSEVAGRIDRQWLDVVLIDRATGREYVAHEQFFPDEISWYDDNGNEQTSQCANGYMLFWHYCGCHRLTSICGDAPDTEVGCPANRFLVKSVIHPSFPDTNLYYEAPISDYTEEHP